VNVKSRGLAVIGIAIGCLAASLAFAKPAATKEKEAPAKEAVVTQPPAVKGTEAVPLAAGGYKIGVINRKSIVKAYAKVAVEYRKLEDEVKSRQVKIDELSNKITKMKDEYEKDKKNMSPAERAEREAAVQSEFAKYRSELQTNQAEIDAKENALMRTVMTEIDDAVKKVGDDGKYHLVLDGSTAAGAVYYSPTVDVSQQVIDKLNEAYKKQ